MSVACRSVDYSETIYFSEYFPLEINETKEYFVTNIAHTSFGKDTSYYFLKEVLSEEFIDSEGDLAFRMERFWKTDSTQDYSIKDIWHAKKTLRSAEKVEENEGLKIMSKSNYYLVVLAGSVMTLFFTIPVYIFTMGLPGPYDLATVLVLVLGVVVFLLGMIGEGIWLTTLGDKKSILNKFKPKFC